MDVLAIRIYPIAFLLFCLGAHISGIQAGVFKICDAFNSDVISNRNGTLIGGKGKDCTRIIVAPKGWRIKFTLIDINMRDALFFIHDGGSMVRKKKDFGVGEQMGGDNPSIFYTSSNAILLHTDRISSNDNRLNATFEMFAQSADSCVCPPTVKSQTICTIQEEDTTIFHFESHLTRKCTTTCDKGVAVITKASTSVGVLEMSCTIAQDQPLKTSWAAKQPARLFNPNLVTCSKVFPATQVHFVYMLTYMRLSCTKDTEWWIQNSVYGFLVGNTSASYVGECFKKLNDSCTVQPVLVSCLLSNDPNKTLIKLVLRDNVKLTQNVTMTRVTFDVLYASFPNTVKDKVRRYVTKDLIVNGTKSTDFKPFNSLHTIPTTCPANSMIITGLTHKSCISCPLHYYQHMYTFGSVCEQCPKTERRELNESMCVNGSQVYPKPSYTNCHHTCALGKFFNNHSGICEWCDYGTFQNTTTDLNPVCQSCPDGNTTAFVGATKVSDCVYICRKGQFAKFPSCIDCPIGYYMPFKGNRYYKCYQCPSGKTTLKKGSSNASNCVDKCSQGEYFNITQSFCVLCPNNTFQDEVKDDNTQSCKTCPANSITLSAGSTSLSACLGPCSPGEYLKSNSRSCEQCPLNAYNDRSNQTSFSCKPCSKHKITQNKGSTNEIQCIYTCNEGRFFNITSEACEKCANNTYQDIAGQDFCKPCAGNTFTLKTGSKTCITPCHFGEFLNKSVEMCQDCPVGYFQDSTNYVSAMCLPCPMDSYTDKSGSKNCTSCPSRGITVVKAAAVLSECIERCLPGFYLNTTAKKCKKCLKGFYQDQSEYRSESCTKCPSANLTTFVTGASTMEQCVGYCASSPCLNGGKCTNIDNDFNCSCSMRLRGKHCEIISDSNDTDKMEISVRFPNLIWYNSLVDPDNKASMDLASRIENTVQEEFKNDTTFRTVKAKNFRQGSVISDLEFNYVAGTNFGNPLDTLKSAIADGKIGNLVVDTTSLDVVNYTCGTPLGMENGRIPDNAITSANKDNYHPFANARLNHNGPGWTPRVNNIEDAYLQVDFQEVVMLTAIATQGSSFDGGQWLESYHFNFSVDGKVFVEYKEDTNYYKVFPGNSDVDTVERNELKYPVRARYVRLIKYTTKYFLSFRCEFYGCPIPKAIRDVLPTLVPPRTDPSSGSTVSTTEKDQGTVNKSDEDDGSNNTGLIVGLVLGILALFIVIGIAIWYFNRKKKAHSSNTDNSTNAMPMPMKETS